jgi:hypothetical protein
MKKVLIFALVVLVGGAAMAVAMGEVTEHATYRWRYKMTVTLETPEGEKSGSAVREISNSIQPVDLPDVGNPAKNTGEAVVVDLGQRGVLFALISDLSDDEFYAAIPTPGYGGTTPKALEYYSNLGPGVKGELTNKRYWPKIVTFTDMNDPKTVRVAYYARPTGPVLTDPLEITDNLEQLFGNGVKLKSITIETTDEPKTKTGILATLPKFDDEFWEWRKKLEYSDPRKISGANFSKGATK